MQKFPATSVGGGVNNNLVGGASGRENIRVDSSFTPSNFSSSSRRQLQLLPYKLKCDKEPLSSRLGPPDYSPQAPNCPEETLTKDYLQSGYKETTDGIEEAREIALTQVGILTKPYISKCREGIKKHLRAINESRAQKRKAGQVYGVPLTGSLLANLGVPEQRSCNEEFRKKWIEGLSQPSKHLSSLADCVPHGYRKKSLFEMLIRHNVPVLRASWFVKVTYLNQVRPVSSSVSSGTSDRSHLARSELWTKDVLEYLQGLLDEFFSKNISAPALPGRDQSGQTFLASSNQQKSDSMAGVLDGEEPTLEYKWTYMVHMVRWHLSEGLLTRYRIIEWVLNQLQEKESIETLQLLLPVIWEIIETLALCQTYVRQFVDLAVRYVQDLSSGALHSVVGSKRVQILSCVVEMLQYLMLSVPDTFVSMDCFPLPLSIFTQPLNTKHNALIQNQNQLPSNLPNSRCLQNSLLLNVSSSIENRASNLTKAVNYGFQGRGMAKVVQALDRAIHTGDLNGAYNCLFEDTCNKIVEENWISEINPHLRSSMKWIGRVTRPLICSIFLLLEWATCDFRDYRTSIPQGVKFTGPKDFSEVYIAVVLLKLHLQSALNHQFGKGYTFYRKSNVDKGIGNVISSGKTVERSSGTQDLSDILESPSPLHDIVVCWLDQHEVVKGSHGLERIQMLILELTCAGIFYPQTYVRQLLVSGVMDKNEYSKDLDRQERHYKILKQLPGSYLRDVLKEAQIAELSVLTEAMGIYASERQLVLQGFVSGRSNNLKNESNCLMKSITNKQNDDIIPRTDWEECHERKNVMSIKNVRKRIPIEEIKAAISSLFHLQNSLDSSLDTQSTDSQVIHKRAIGSISSNVEISDRTSGCEECRRTKRHKTNDFYKLADEVETWWIKRIDPKPLDVFKVDVQSLKTTKTASKSKQKIVRKTQSLAQLAAARIESSQGASTSHVCESKINCPHHWNPVEREIPKSVEAISSKLTDIGSIGKAMKQLRLLEKRSITLWLISSIRKHVEVGEKSFIKTNQSIGSFSSMIEDKSLIRWKLGEEELSSLLYLLDTSSDLLSAMKFLLWLLPKVPSSPVYTVHGGRNVVKHPKSVDNYACDISEAYLLSSLRRYENVLVSSNLLPEALSSALQRAGVVIGSNGRVSSSLSFLYARYLLKKYGNVDSVSKWEKNFRTTCDQRLLAELEYGRELDGEMGFSVAGIPSGVEDYDDFFRQKIRPRAGSGMKEIVQRHVDEAMNHFYNKEQKLFSTNSSKSTGIEKWDESYQKAQQVVLNLMDCIRQNGCVTLEGDPSMVASAVSTIVSNAMSSVLKMLDFSPANNHQSFPSTLSPLNCARHILHIHITCLCLLKEALGERQSRVFEIALCMEASSIVSSALSPSKSCRNQFQSSPNSQDSNSNLVNENSDNPPKIFMGRPAKAIAAVSSLVVGAIVHGITSLERMVTLFKLKEGLDILQFTRNNRINSNGNSRLVNSSSKPDNIEMYLHWFRLLLGNCKMVSNGLVAELLGDSYILSLSRMQRMLPLNLVFHPVYSIFAMVIWRPYIISDTLSTREDAQFLLLTSAIHDVIRHRPFRDVLLRNTVAFYDLIVSDSSDSEFASMLELHNPDKHLKMTAFIPLRSRLFLNAILDCKITQSGLMQDVSWVSSGHSETKLHAENDRKLHEKVVLVLDTLQPAKFHWQWVELRLLLNEQALIEKFDHHNMSLVEAIRSLSQSPDGSPLSDNESTFTEIVMTRLLVRPDAASLYSEVVHLLGKSLEESLLKNVKWFLAGSDVLLGRKSIRQRLSNLAQVRNLSSKPQFWKPWGWCHSFSQAFTRVDRRKLEPISLEEGEVIEEGIEIKRSVKSISQTIDSDFFSLDTTERALSELVLPCIDRISSESRILFASDLIKQMFTIEQHINSLTHSSSKQISSNLVTSGVEASKNINRKGIRGGSPGLGRRSSGTTDPSSSSSVALHSSMWLRLQFLLKLMPVICANREQSGHNMRHMLASVILRLLGTRVVHEDVDVPCAPLQRKYMTKRERDTLIEVPITASLDLSDESLFDNFVCVLHGLLSSCKPSWLKSRSVSKSTTKSLRDFLAFEREAAETLQSELDRMQLPGPIRRRLQAAIPILPPSPQLFISCQLPFLPTSSLVPFLCNSTISSVQMGNINQPNARSATRNLSNVSIKSKSLSLQDLEMEIDPWMLLEDGTNLSGDQNSLKASNWLWGAVRIRRTDLSYTGSLDDDG